MRQAVSIRFRIARLQCFDIVEMFNDSARIAFASEGLIPLIVIVEDDRDRVVEIRDEAIVRGAMNEKVEALIELRKITITLIEIVLQIVMFFLMAARAVQAGCSVARRPNSGGRMQLEHFAHIGQFQSEFAGEALQDPMAVSVAFRSSRNG